MTITASYKNIFFNKNQTNFVILWQNTYQDDFQIKWIYIKKFKEICVEKSRKIFFKHYHSRVNNSLLDLVKKQSQEKIISCEYNRNYKNIYQEFFVYNVIKLYKILRIINY
jgi:hypothetical protein